MQVQQTEIDALGALRPRLLRQLALDAIDPFSDHTLDRRVFEAQSRWVTEAQAAVDRDADAEQMERFRAEAERKLADLRAEIDAINDALRIDGARPGHS